MKEQFSYSYEDLINASNEMMGLATKFGNQIGDLEEYTGGIERNYQSENSARIVSAIKTVSENATEFQSAIMEFARAIGNEIARDYKAIEENAAASASGTYGA